MEELATVYLTPAQAAAITRLDFVIQGRGFHVTQASPLSTIGKEFDGHVLVGENMGAPPVQIDKEGEIVPRKAPA